MPFQLACARDASLMGRPLAFLAPGQQGQTPCLWLVNRLARMEGVCAGLPLDRAVRACPSLSVLDPSPRLWWEAHAGFCGFLSRWTPQGLVGRMGEALLELGGLGHVHGGPADTAGRMLRELSGSMGWSGHGGLSESGMAARLAARLEHGLECVRSGSEAGFLAPHPLGALPGLEAKPLARLRRLGLFLVKDIQPLPIGVLGRFMDGVKARGLLQCARGEDRPRLPMLADRPGESRHNWRMEPPELPESVPLAPWLLDKIWCEARSPRSIQLKWWDADGEIHRLRADDADLSAPPLALARAVERTFRRLAVRRVAVGRVEAHIAWGLGRAKGLFADYDERLDALEPALARLRKRFPKHPVLPGWVRAAGF